MSGYVYAIGIEGSPLVKIGHAKNVQRRLAGLQIGLPFKLELLYQLEVEQPRLVEACLHEGLDDSRARGEWFQVAAEELPELFAAAIERAALIKSAQPRQAKLARSPFSLRLERAIKEKGWNLTELAERSGLHYQQIYKLRSGETPDPRVSTMRRLAQALGVTTDYLLGINEGAILGDQFDANVRKATPSKPARKRKVAS